MLELFDQDHDGTLSEDEIADAMQLMGFSWLERRLMHSIIKDWIDWWWFKYILRDLCERLDNPHSVPLCLFPLDFLDPEVIHEADPLPGEAF